MQATSPVETLSCAVGHAAHCAFSEIHYQNRDWEHYRATGEDRRVDCVRAHTPDDVQVAAMFVQTWGSTALGFGGIGGQAITPAYTVVVRSTQLDEYAVYFGGRFAYMIQHPNSVFFEHMSQGRMHKVDGAQALYRTPEATG